MSNRNMQIAKTILEQLGGKRFLVMTGSSNCVASQNSLSMKLVRNKASATHLIITIDPSDTYTMEFLKIRLNKLELERTTVEKLSDVYCEDLQDIFTRVTGLYTKL